MVGVRHNVWMMFINELVRAAAGTSEGAALIEQFAAENDATTDAVRSYTEAVFNGR